MGFNFETITQAHETAIRAMAWTNNDQWLATGDHQGYVKYWQQNLNNVHMFQAHKDTAVRAISFSPTDRKFATASDDSTVRIWDFLDTGGSALKSARRWNAAIFWPERAFLGQNARFCGNLGAKGALLVQKNSFSTV